MCCSKRRQQRLLQQQQDLLIGGVQYQPRQRGCCGSRRRNHNLINYSAIAPSTEITQIQQPQYFCAGRPQRQTMAGILIVSLGIGAEKLGRKISEKRLERKERKASEQRELMYGTSESSSSNVATVQERLSRLDIKPERKSEEVRREGARRRSVSSERTLLPEDAPPRYEDAIRHSAGRQ